MDNTKVAFSEVYEIINLMSYDLRCKIPQKFINLIETQRDKEYKPQIERNIPLEEQNLQEETIGILAFLKLNCFCNEKEKIQFMTMLNENERKFQEEMNKKYNPDDIFKKLKEKNEMTEKSNEGKQLVEQKEFFASKLKKIIFKLLHIYS